MITEEEREQAIALYQAIADLLRSGSDIPVPGGSLSVYTRDAEQVKTILRSLPVPWKAVAPRPGGTCYNFTGDVGDYIIDGVRMTVRVKPGLVATEGETRQVKVTEWFPHPEIAALLATPETTELPGAAP